MDLEIIIVRGSETKDKYHIPSLICNLKYDK